jgi:hypothetical protein
VGCGSGCLGGGHGHDAPGGIAGRGLVVGQGSGCGVVIECWSWSAEGGACDFGFGGGGAATGMFCGFGEAGCRLSGGGIVGCEL